MKVVITSATQREAFLIKEVINSKSTFDNSKLNILFHESGIGVLSSCFSISKLIYEQKPDLIIQVGIAGTFDKEVPLSTIVVVKEEVLADTGVEENGNFKDLFDLNLQSENVFPFIKKRLINNELTRLNFLQLKEVPAITINEISTRLERIEQLKVKYNPAIESMEGASLHYCCLQTSTSFIQIRAVSNYIGERDKGKWELEESFRSLRNVILLYLDHLLK